LAHEIWPRLNDEYGKISELKRAQLNASLRSLRKSPETKIRDHVDEFERIQREIEFHSEAMSPTDVNIAFLISLGDSETWKNYRNSNLHRAINMKTADLLAEVTLIDDTTSSTSFSGHQARALSTSFRGGHRGRGGYRGGYRGHSNREPVNQLPFDAEKHCSGCQR
jgi:hypothetical protein